MTPPWRACRNRLRARSRRPELSASRRGNECSGKGLARPRQLLPACVQGRLRKGFRRCGRAPERRREERPEGSPRLSVRPAMAGGRGRRAPPMSRSTVSPPMRGRPVSSPTNGALWKPGYCASNGCRDMSSRTRCFPGKTRRLDGSSKGELGDARRGPPPACRAVWHANRHGMSGQSFAASIAFDRQGAGHLDLARRET